MIKSHGWAASVWSDGGKHLVFSYEDQTFDEQVRRDEERREETSVSLCSVMQDTCRILV